MDRRIDQTIEEKYCAIFGQMAHENNPGDTFREEMFRRLDRMDQMAEILELFTLKFSESQIQIAGDFFE